MAIQRPRVSDVTKWRPQVGCRLSAVSAASSVFYGDSLSAVRERRDEVTRRRLRPQEKRNPKKRRMR